jgi:uncharacterized membrane protein
MSISSLIGSRLLSGIAALALSGSLVGTALASEPDHPIREIRHEVRDQSKVQREEIKQLRAEFAAEYAKPQPDAKKLEQLQADIEAKRAEISDLRFAALMQMHDQLDAEQRAKLAEKLGHEGKRGGEGKGKGNMKGKPEGKGKPDMAERGKAMADGKGKSDMAGKGKPEGKGKPDMAERGKAMADGKGKPDMAERGKAMADGKGKSDMAERGKGKGSRAPL